MKRKICNVLLLFFILFFVTGCVKFNANMNIKKDKSMDFEIIYAVDSSYFTEQSILEDDERLKLEESGFTISDYKNANMKGVTIFKKIPNIDSVSSTDDTSYNLSGLFESDVENEYIFKVKKGLLKNVYLARINFDSSDSSLNDYGDIGMGYDDTVAEDENESDSEESNLDNNFDYMNNFMSSLDMSFNVTLPYAALSNNATEVTNDGKSLRWLLTATNASVMEFEFELYNMNIIYIGVGIIVVLVLLAVLFVVKKKNKKVPSNEQKNQQVLNSELSQTNTEQNLNNGDNQQVVQNSQEIVSLQNNEILSSNDLSTAITNNDVIQNTDSNLYSLNNNLNDSNVQEQNMFSQVNLMNNNVVSTDNVLMQPQPVNQNNIQEQNMISQVNLMNNNVVSSDNVLMQPQPVNQNNQKIN